jgi:lipopolysaccharide/colanic/teichoic acid biosynthesis glycosyltransferase
MPRFSRLDTRYGTEEDGMISKAATAVQVQDRCVIAGEFHKQQSQGEHTKEEEYAPYTDVRYSKVIHRVPIEKNRNDGVQASLLSYSPSVAGTAVLGVPGSIAIDVVPQETELHGIENRYLYRFVKRAFDISLSLFALVACSWLYLIVALLVKLDDPSAPVFFKQTRIGKDGYSFDMYKFRTMCVDAESKLEELKELNEKTGPVFKMSDDPRVTRVGKWLRKLSLDELPQFFNVLRGDMSVIGPRPALPDEVAAYTNYQRQRLMVPAGITCYWQTQRNRDSISFEEWIDLDLLYIKECGLWTDIKLVAKTIWVMLTAQGN